MSKELYLEALDKLMAQTGKFLCHLHNRENPFPTLI